MDPVLQEAYSTVLSGAPFVIAAYAFILLVMVVLVVAMIVRARKTQGEIEALRESIDRLERKQTKEETDAR